jgi:hypothetical protein
MNQMVDFFKSQEERDRLFENEQLRRKGEVFIKVRYQGSIIPKTDSEGLCYNIRIHGLQDMVPYESTDMNTGKTEWKGRKGAQAITFRQSSLGDIEADIWDDPDHWNRRFISTHPELYVVDDKLRREIAKEKDKPFNPEPSEKELLEREISEKVQRLNEITAKEKADKKNKKDTSDMKVTKVDGVDESTSDVDRS